MNKDFANAIERNSRRHLVVSFEDSNFSDKSLLRLHMADSGEKVNLRVAPKAVDVLMTSLKFDEAVVSDMFKQRPADAMAFLSQIVSRKQIGVPPAELATALTKAAATRKANLQPRV